jgi:hypothetical protein
MLQQIEVKVTVMKNIKFCPNTGTKTSIYYYIKILQVVLHLVHDKNKHIHHEINSTQIKVYL